MMSSPLYTAESYDDQNKLKVAVFWCVEMLVPLYQTAWHHIVENCNLYIHRCENQIDSGSIVL